jgi:hypothetical protein
MNNQSYKGPSKFNLPKSEPDDWGAPYMRLPNGDVVEVGNLEYLMVSRNWLIGWEVELTFRGDDFSYTEFFLLKRDAIAYREAILETIKAEVQ